MTHSDPGTARLALSRRSALGLAASAGVGAALAPSSSQAACPTMRAAAGGAPQTVTALSRPDRVFLHRGLMHGAWVRNDASVFAPSASTWTDSGFTAPTFYDGYPLWNPTLMSALPHNTTWAVAKAPYATHLNDTLGYPDPSLEWLSPEQLARVDDLFTACFGDEDNYSERYMDYLIAAYARMHEVHPDVLVHTNQALGQFDDTQMRSYIRRAKPDLITYDFYYWQRATFYPGGSVAALYRTTGRYRRLALEGLDGTGAQPIAFGQYTTGFRLIPPPNTVGGLRRFVVSESQQKGVSFVTLAMGGKWLDLFRWEGYAATTSDSDGHFLAYPDGTPTPQFTRYQELNRSIRSLSPYLVRLRSRTVSVQPGTVGDSTLPRQTQGEVPDFAPTVDPGAGVVEVAATNQGAANGGQPGDVLLGTFRQLPEMSPLEAAGVFPDPEVAVAFMVVNALIVSNSDPLVDDTLTDYAPHTATGGNGADTQQLLTVTVDPSAVDPDVRPGKARGKGRDVRLFRVDRATGEPVRVPLTAAGPHFTFTATIPGGEGELYFWG